MGATVTAQMVRELRDATGAGMMDCKKALSECEGDIERAADFLRIKSGAKAERVASRTAGEGRLSFCTANGVGVLAEINCETDFVARGDDFVAFCRDWATAVASAKSSEAALEGENGEQARKALVMKVGENVSFGRSQILTATGEVAFYMHTGDKIAAMADYSGDNAETAREVCMHIAAMRPEYLRLEDVPSEELQRQREIFVAQAAESGKPPAVAEKMAEGRLNKHFAERVLELQPYVKNNGETTVGEALAAAGVRLNAFHWIVVGGSHI